MNRRSKSTLFLMEQLIVVAVFAICAAACVTILTESFFIANETRDHGNAILIAESGAECFKNTAGNIGKVADLMGGAQGSVDGNTAAIVYYDESWLVCGETDAAYRMQLVRNDSGSGGQALISGVLSVEKMDGEEIIAFPVSARGGA